MAAGSMRLWLCRATAGLCLSLLFLFGWTPRILADPEMDAHVREIVTEHLAPQTAGHPGGVAAAAYVAGRVQFFNFGFADEAQKRRITSETLFHAPELLRKTVQGYSEHGAPIGPPGNQQGYFDFPGTGQMFSTARDLVTFMVACIDGNVADPQLREALRMTQAKAFHVDRKFGQAMAWVLGDVAIDKPGGLNDASAYVGDGSGEKDRAAPPGQPWRIFS